MFYIPLHWIGSEHVQTSRYASIQSAFRFDFDDIKMWAWLWDRVWKQWLFVSEWILHGLKSPTTWLQHNRWQRMDISNRTISNAHFFLSFFQETVCYSLNHSQKVFNIQLNEENSFFLAEQCQRHMRGSACEEQKPSQGCAAALTCVGGQNPHWAAMAPQWAWRERL